MKNYELLMKKSLNFQFVARSTSFPFDIFVFKVVSALKLSFLKMHFISFVVRSDLQHNVEKICQSAKEGRKEGRFYCFRKDTFFKQNVGNHHRCQCVPWPMNIERFKGSFV